MNWPRDTVCIHTRAHAPGDIFTFQRLKILSSRWSNYIDEFINGTIETCILVIGPTFQNEVSEIFGIMPLSETWMPVAIFVSLGVQWPLAADPSTR